MVHICTCFKCSLLKKSFRVSGKITNNIRLFKEKGRKNGESKEFFLERSGGITGTHSRKQGLKRGTDARETRREWRLTGIQTVADSVLPGAKKSATTGKTPCGCRQKVCD